MAQAEVLSLVATAIDQATPVLAQVQRSLDQLKISAVGLSEPMAKSDAAVRAYGEAFRGASIGVRAFHAQQRVAAAASRDLQSQMSRFAGTLGREVASGITRVQSAIVSSTVSVVAFKKQLQATKELTEFAKATGFSRDTVRGLQEAAQDLGLPAEKTQQILGRLSSKLQDMRFLGGGRSLEATPEHSRDERCRESNDGHRGANRARRNISGASIR